MLPEEEASPSEVFSALLEDQSPGFGLSLAQPAKQRLAQFLSDLDLARRRTNLTGPVSPAELTNHALESVVGASLITHGARVIDIGSGAGFPGIPLAIVREDLLITAIEPRRRRLNFLRDAVEKLGLSNIEGVEAKLSSIGRATTDVATSRAVASIDQILGDAAFLKERGLFLAWTTTAGAPGLARGLLGRFSLQAQVSVPQSRQKVIVAFRKAPDQRKNVPRGTKRFAPSPRQPEKQQTLRGRRSSID